jgi:hypothetical protein
VQIQGALNFGVCSLYHTTPHHITGLFDVAVHTRIAQIRFGQLVPSIHTLYLMSYVLCPMSYRLNCCVQCMYACTIRLDGPRIAMRGKDERQMTNNDNGQESRVAYGGHTP